MHNPNLILIVDDEADIVALLERICHQQQWATIVAPDGPTALAMAVQQLPDLILLDVQIPYMDGFETLIELRKKTITQRIPIIIVTAAAIQPDDFSKGINLGADDYIQKPFHRRELQARIRAKLQAKELEEKLRQRTLDLAMLVELGNKLNNLHDLQLQSQEVLLFIMNSLEAQAGLLHLLPSANIDRHSVICSPQGVMQARDMAHLDQLLRNEDIPQWLDQHELAAFFPPSFEFKIGIMVNLYQQQFSLGMICLAHQSPDFFDHNDLLVMRSVAEQVAMGMVNVQLYETLRSHAQHLEQMVEARTQDLKTAQRQLARTEKLAALGRLSGEIAHEINNPLQPIMSCLEGAIEDLEAQQPVAIQDLQLAMAEVSRLKRTVARLLDFARPDSTQKTGVKINALLEEVLALTTKKMTLAQVKWRADLQPLPTISANADQLKQVFLNIFINACDAMSETQDRHFTIQTEVLGVWIVIQIADTGKGIDPDHLQQIFEPFFSTKEQGSGLGLAISHSIITAHNGTIDVQSQVNKGTCFTIRLPVL
jgi:signal transduction histidine kinase